MQWIDKHVELKCATTIKMKVTDYQILSTLSYPCSVRPHHCSHDVYVLSSGGGPGGGGGPVALHPAGDSAGAAVGRHQLQAAGRCAGSRPGRPGLGRGGQAVLRLPFSLQRSQSGIGTHKIQNPRLIYRTAWLCSVDCTAFDRF